MLSQEKMVGHPRNVVAHNTMPGGALGQFGVELGHGFRMIQVEFEQLSQRGPGPLAVHHNCRMVV